MTTTSASPDPKPRRRFLQFSLRSFFILMTLFAVWFGWAMMPVYTSLRAEKADHATLLTTQVIEDHVMQHDGQWPRSWTELEQSPSRSRAMFKWPNDRAEIQPYVWVDFDADANYLARQSADEFRAIEPIGPYYPWEDYPELSSLLETLRSTRGEPKASQTWLTHTLR